MKIIEKIKTNHLIRVLISLIQITVSFLMAKFNELHGIFFYFSIPLMITGFYYLIVNLSLIGNKQIIPVESKSRNILWIIGSSIVLISFVNLISKNYLDSINWSLLFLWQLFYGIIIETRHNVIVVYNKSVLRYGFPWRTRIKYSEIDNIKEESDIITLQSKNKDFIVINLKMSTQYERQKIILAIDNIKHSAQQMV